MGLHAYCLFSKKTTFLHNTSRDDTSLKLLQNIAMTSWRQSISCQHICNEMDNFKYCPINSTQRRVLQPICILRTKGYEWRKFRGQFFLFQTNLFWLKNPETFTFQGSPSIKSAMINFYRPNGGRYNPHSKLLPGWLGRGGRWTSLDASFARCFAIFWNIVKTSHR